MRSLFALTALAAFAASPAFAETKSYNFNSFNKLDISAGYEVIFTQGAQRSVTIESNDFSKIIAEQRGDTLHIARPRNTNLRGNVHDVVRITAPDLEEIELNAGVEFKADGLNVDNLRLELNAGVEALITRIKAQTLTVDVNAGVELELAGECGTLELDAQAGVEVDADQLRCKSATVDAGVGSDVTVHVTDRIKADAGLGASIRVAGQPKDVDQHESLGGKVTISR